MIKQLLILGLIGIGIKILLIPAYFSTDFDVHHNWLRITYTKPLSEWYYDDVSKWTLDYPPFFAYFQYALAAIANYINPSILKLIVTNDVINFQRISVILTDIPFLYMLYIIFNRKVCFQLVLSYFFLPLIILDNIHFQYNIMLQTIFLTSLYFLLIKQNYLIAALTYSILLNFKHIYLYCSIAYFAIILKNYVLKSTNKYSLEESQNQNKQKLTRFIKVAIITILPFVVSFGPFIITGGISGLTQIFSRLFPFGRGLIHDYWAPNFWALYYFADKIIAFIFKVVFRYESHLSITPTDKPLNYLKILLQPSANFTLLIILVSLIPLVLYIIKAKKIDPLRIILVNGLIFFMFGYHVHEKAITPYLHLYYVFLCSSKYYEAKSQHNYEKLSLEEQDSENINKKLRIQKDKTTQQNNFKINQFQTYCLIFFNILNLFPLLIDVKEKPFKLIVALIYWILIKNYFKDFRPKKLKIHTIFYNNLLNSCLILVVICQVIIPVLNWTNENKFQFLPLMINSVICALVNLVWILKTYLFLVKIED